MAPAGDLPPDETSALVAALRSAQELERRSRLAATTLADPVMVCRAVRDAGGQLVDLAVLEANPGAARLFGAAPGDIVGRTMGALAPGGMDGPGLAHIAQALVSGTPRPLPQAPLPAAAGLPLLRSWVAPVGVDDRLAIGWSPVVGHREQHLADRERELHRWLVHDSEQPLVAFDEANRVTWATPGFCAVVGRTARELLALSLDEILPGWGEVPADDLLSLRRPDGSTEYVRARSFPAAGPGAGLLSLERLTAPPAPTRDEFADPLTGLPMWPELRERLRRQFPDDGGQAVMCLGIDHLTDINEGTSFEAGDAVLSHVAASIRLRLPAGFAMARLGGDQFVVVAAADTDPRHVAALLGRIHHGLGRVPLAPGVATTPSLSSGVAYRQDREGLDELLRRAGLTMHLAKRAGGDTWLVHDPTSLTAPQRRPELETRLERALAGGEFETWLQPVVDLATGRVVGHEALARWVAGDGGMFDPGDFVPVAETSQLIRRLDRLVLEQALAAAGGRPADLTIAINVSFRTLCTPDFPAEVIDAVRASGIAPQTVHLELAESALRDIDHEAVAAMVRLADAGLRWVVDDFGTGFSPLARLRDLPLSGVKLDRTCSAAVLGNDSARRLARGLAGLAEGLELMTIAAGVETEPQRRILADQGWRHGQGFLFGRPQPPG